MIKFINTIDKVVRRLFLVFFTSILIVGLVVKPIYRFDDYAIFGGLSLMDIVIMMLMMGIAYVIIKYADRIESFLNIRAITVIALILGLGFIYLLPLKPFSDMTHVAEGAINFANFNFSEILNSEYLQTFKGNINLVVIFGLPMIFLPKSIFTIKVINLVLLVGSSYFLSKSAMNIGINKRKLVYSVSLTMISWFIYINHIYFDVLFIFICILSFYIYSKNRDNIIYAMIILAFGCLIRSNVLIFVVAYLIDYVIFKLKTSKKGITFNLKSLLKNIGISVVIIVLVSNIFNLFLKSYLFDTEYKTYSLWNQFYIGINEPKIGFMDGDFDYERSFDDVKNRMIEYGPTRMTKIVTQKIVWTWMEGTYQASRYAFGLDSENVLDKFEYETPITRYFMTSNQFTRLLITSIMRAQYLCLFAFMVLGVWRRKEVGKYRVIYYVFLLTFGVLLLYEMKSRYIIHCLPFMILLAFSNSSLTNQNNEKGEVV